MERTIMAKRIAEELTMARAKSGLSQKQLADRIGVTKKTIQNWESSFSFPNFYEVLIWFVECHQNPTRALKYVLYGNVCEGNKSSEDEERKKAYQNIDDMTLQEIRCFNFLMSEDHGGSPYAFWQEIVENLQSSIGRRRLVAITVDYNYNDALNRNNLTCPNAVQPDIKAFKTAISLGDEAYYKGERAYVLKAINNKEVEE